MATVSIVIVGVSIGFGLVIGILIGRWYERKYGTKP